MRKTVQIKSHQPTIIEIINSPIVEAFSIARSLEGGCEDSLLINYYEIGATAGKVLSIKPSVGALQALYMMARAGSRVICINCPHSLGALQPAGMTCMELESTKWLASFHGGKTIDTEYILLDAAVDTEYILLDAAVDLKYLSCLKGKFRITTKIIVHGQIMPESPLCLFLGVHEDHLDRVAVYTKLPAEFVQTDY
jgi:hypothetical protein